MIDNGKINRLWMVNKITPQINKKIIANLKINEFKSFFKLD